MAGVLALVTLLGCDLETRGRILWGEGTAPEGGALPDGSAHVVIRSGQATAQLGGDGGDPYTDICPTGEAVVGFHGETLPDDAGLIVVVAQIQASCGKLAVDPSGAVTVAPIAMLPEHGMYTGPSWADLCGANQVVVGFSGRSGQYVDDLSFECAHWVVSNVGGSAVLTIDGTSTLPPAGGDGGSAFPAVSCPPGEMAVGTALRSGFWLDAFSLVCGTPGLEDGAGP